MHDNKKPNNYFLLREAEMIINNYIKENKMQRDYPTKSIPKSMIANKKRALNSAVINLAIVAGIVLLILFVSKII